MCWNKKLQLTTRWIRTRSQNFRVNIASDIHADWQRIPRGFCPILKIILDFNENFKYFVNWGEAKLSYSCCSFGCLIGSTISWEKSICLIISIDRNLYRKLKIHELIWIKFWNLPKGMIKSNYIWKKYFGFNLEIKKLTKPIQIMRIWSNCGISFKTLYGRNLPLKSQSDCKNTHRTTVES